jgi:hypothetical protein
MKTITAIPLLAILTASLTFGDEKKTKTASDDQDACDYAAFLEAAISVGELREARVLNEKEFIAAAKEKGTVILDARSEEFYNQSHIKGAINLPYTHFSASALEALIPDQSTKILIYCRNNIADVLNLEDAANNGFPVKPADLEPADQSSVKPNEVKEFIYPSDYQPPELPKGVGVGLNIPTFITLYSYGYRNIWELNDIIDPNDSKIQFVGKAIDKGKEDNIAHPSTSTSTESKSGVQDKAKTEFNRDYFLKREDVTTFFRAFEGKSLETVSESLWKPRAKHTNNGITSVWYTRDDPPFLVLEKSEKLVLGGFTLRFKDDGLYQYELDFR